MLLSTFSLFGQEDKSENEFKFDEPKDKPVFTCTHIIIDKSPILFVERDSAGDWQFLCGNEYHTTKDAKVISLKQAVQLDKTLNDLFEMPRGAGALRKVIGGKWYPFKT